MIPLWLREEIAAVRIAFQDIAASLKLIAGSLEELVVELRKGRQK